MYHYYTYDGRTLCSAGALPYPEIYPPCRRRERCFGCFIGRPWPGGTPSR